MKPISKKLLIAVMLAGTALTVPPPELKNKPISKNPPRTPTPKRYHPKK